MSHPLLDWHFHDLRKCEFVSIFRDELVHLFVDFLSPKLFLIVDVLFLLVIDG